MASACCKAPNPELRRKKSLNGPVFQRQCSSCGAKVGRPIDLDRIERPGDVPLWDLKKAHRSQPNSRRREYLRRFKKADWKRLRALVLERDRYLCQQCGAPAKEIHHRTYDRFGQERMDDLEASCSRCNRGEREQRIARAVLGS